MFTSVHTPQAGCRGGNEAACTLQQRGLIDYSRGNIRILDHAGLERAACSCYKRVRGRDHARAG